MSSPPKSRRALAMAMTELELLTVGRISIDLYCDQLGADWHEATSFSKAVGGSPTNVAIARRPAGPPGRRVHEGRRATRSARWRSRELARLRRRHPVRRRRARTRVTPLAFAALDPPEDPQAAVPPRAAGPGPPARSRRGRRRHASGASPLLWISGGALSARAQRAAPSSSMLRARGRTPAHDPRPRLPARRSGSRARRPSATNRRRRATHAHGRRRQPRGVRGRGRHARTRTRRARRLLRPRRASWRS